MVQQKALDEIVNRIVTGYDPLAVILFGSQATGRANEDSDIDIMVLKDDPQRPVDRNRYVRRLLFGIEYPIDVFVKTPEEFAKYRDVAGSLNYAVSREGRVLYERGK